jgi:metal-responsive CopG/Arc/MetJ family transcriptional regulator
MVLDMKAVCVELTKGQIERLDKAAKTTGESRSDLIRESITVFLNQLDKRLLEVKSATPMD